MSLEFSKLEKLQLAFRLIFLAPWQISFNILRSLLLSLYRGLPIQLYLTCAVIRVVLGRFSPRQIQYLSTSTRDTYKEWVARKISRAKRANSADVLGRLRCEIEPLEDGTSNLLWVGNRQNARKFILFFHGGGYISPMLPGHLEWCWRAYVAAGMEAGVETAVAVLEYTLCPAAKYPVQLCQAASGLRRLLSSGIAPGDIIIGGDSAGANLTAQLLCHILRPRQPAPKIDLTESLAATFMVSPWLGMRTSHASFKENHAVDMLSATIVDKSAFELFGAELVESDGHEPAKAPCPLDMDPSALVGLDAVTRELYVTAGELEVLRDHGVEFVKMVKTCNPGLNVRLDIQEKMAHDFILLEGLQEREGAAMGEMKRWMIELLVRSRKLDSN
ncbi:Alpha/beta hydrolase fold protein [Pleurostoma richardsiae]|uniref:Alpha/beta hydrolase fold protein n=1 Tax=Pleurostoma richardsiae TaxID=41990 RepID=A0AA38VK42_9PEZI|nr:Alpha/beta hydrolase fold protein [Pleurostoma richardsiae]